jgi:hypothetical protein
VGTRYLRRLLSLSRADALLLLAFGVVLVAEIVVLKRPSPPARFAEQLATPEPADPAPSFDANFGSMEARRPRVDALEPERTGCLVPNGSEYFFPRGTFLESSPPRWRRPMDAHMRAGFSATLRQLDEPSFSCRNRAAQQFRFLWVRAFQRPLAIRILLPTDPAFAASVHLTDEPARPLMPGEQRELIAAFERTEFWTMPTFKDAVGLDGASWVVEARLNGHYHVVDRWSPSPGPFRDLGLMFMRVARLPTQGPDVY